MASIVILWVMPPPPAAAPSEAKAESDIERKRAKAEKRFLRFIEVNELKRLLFLWTEDNTSEGALPLREMPM
jgi:hypothetical protein